MRWIIESSLKLRLLIVIIAAAVMFFGVMQLRDMPVDVLPEFAPLIVEIQTEALGLSAAEVEELVTVPMEAVLLNGVAWVDTMYSESVPGLSSIVLAFQPGTDLLDARQMVQERLVGSTILPNVASPPAMLQPLSATNRVMMVGLTSEEQSGIEMSVLARWNIRPRLMGVPGVANVSIWGQRQRQLQVQVDPEELRDANVSLQQVIRSTGNALWVSPLTFLEASTPGSGGFIDTPTQRLVARHVLPILTEKELARVSVDGAPGVTLGDIADVVEDHQPLIGDAVINNGPGVLLVVEKFPWADTVEVTEEVESAMRSLQPGLPGIHVDTSLFRPASYVSQSMGNITMALIIAAILVVVALVVLQFDWRAALISIVTIPVSLVVATLVIYLLGGTMNLMVMAGFLLALAVIIDDAIVDSENMVHRLRQGQAGDERSKAVIILSAALEMRTPVIYATIIMLAAAVPFFFMSGVAGAFLEPVAFAYIVGFLVSLGVALILTPALGSLLFGFTSTPRGVSPAVSAIRKGYDALLSATVRNPVPALAVAAVIAVVGVAMVPLLSQDLVPKFKENDILIRWEGHPGISRAGMVQIATDAGHELRAIPGVHNVTSHVGRAILGDEVVGISSGQMWVSIDPGSDYNDTVAAVRAVVDRNPNLNRGVNTFIQERINDVLKGAQHDLVVRVFGDDLDILDAKAQEVQQALSRVDGIVDAEVEPQDTEPILEIEVDLDAAAEHGIKPGDVRRSAATMVQGIVVGNLFEEQKVFDVVVVGKPNFRSNVSDVENMLIETPAGGFVRLNEVANIQIVDSLTNIKRETISRRVDVWAQISGRSRGEVISDVERAIASVSFPREYHAEIVGTGAEQIASKNRLITIAIASAIAIFLLLQAALGSWRLGALSFLAIAVAMAGGLVTLALGGGVLSIGSVAGFFALLALAARNGITLIRHYQRLHAEEGMEFGPELVLRGTQERFGSILTTAVVVALAMLPFVALGAAPGYAVAFPMALVILGGLVTTTVVSLFVIPALYLSLRVSRRPEVFAGAEAA